MEIIIIGLFESVLITDFEGFALQITEVLEIRVLGVGRGSIVGDGGKLRGGTTDDNLDSLLEHPLEEFLVLTGKARVAISVGEENILI